MSLILNIESSSKNCSVSISKNGKIIALQEQSFEEYSHSKSLHVFIDKLFKEIETTNKLINIILFTLPFFDKNKIALNKKPCKALITKKRLKNSLTAIFLT